MTDGRASAEFTLVAACCRWPTDVAAIRAAASAPIRPQRIVALTRRHRVAGLVCHGLAAAGLTIPPLLVARHRRMAARNLLLLDEAARLAAACANAGIPVAFLKGTTLAELAYAGQQVKETFDIDLLVGPENVVATMGLLEGAGYRLVSPAAALDSKQLSVLIDMVKECMLVHADNRAVVDLHWRATSVKGLLTEPDLTRDVRLLTVDGHDLPTLESDVLMLYLAVHGARHGWSRLKWLADFNALLAAMDAASVAALRDRAAREGVGRALDLALLQANRLFATPVPEGVGRSRRVRWLAALSDRLMRGPDELAQQVHAPWRYMAIGYGSAPLLKSSPVYLGHAAWSSWVSTQDALALPLPRAARPLYLVVSPARRIARAVRRIVDRGFSRKPDRPMRARQEN